MQNKNKSQKQNKSQNLTIYVEKVKGTTVYLERLKENSNQLIKSV